MERIIIQV